uniref:Uncharacterized protein n=1 Tax=Kalanchoe fedtschenkoi TaxID=63787 RepID=A0A7N0UA39_KALFE
MCQRRETYYLCFFVEGMEVDFMLDTIRQILGWPVGDAARMDRRHIANCHASDEILASTQMEPSFLESQRRLISEIHPSSSCRR